MTVPRQLKEKKEKQKKEERKGRRKERKGKKKGEKFIALQFLFLPKRSCQTSTFYGFLKTGPIDHGLQWVNNPPCFRPNTRDHALIHRTKIECI